MKYVGPHRPHGSSTAVKGLGCDSCKSIGNYEVVGDFGDGDDFPTGRIVGAGAAVYTLYKTSGGAASRFITAGIMGALGLFMPLVTGAAVAADYALDAPVVKTVHDIVSSFKK